MANRQEKKIIPTENGVVLEANELLDAVNGAEIESSNIVGYQGMTSCPRCGTPYSPYILGEPLVRCPQCGKEL